MCTISGYCEFYERDFSGGKMDDKWSKKRWVSVNVTDDM